MTQISKQLPRTPRDAIRCAGPLDALLDAEMFKGLCDPTRLGLLGCLAKCGRGCTVSELAECCSVDLSVVSRHLALLQRAGIVTSEKRGREVSYIVRYADMTRKLRALADALAACRPTGKKAECRDGDCCG